MFQVKNGESSPKSNGVTNGVHLEDGPVPVSSSVDKKGKEDIVRIIGQHLLTMGLT
jgi:hypothetical protein